MKIKVAQCWDDGIINDIRLTEILRKYGAKATFNLNPGFMKETRGSASFVSRDFQGWSYNGFLCGKLSTKDIPEIYDGFELASHGWRHEVAGQVPDDVFIQAAVDARKYLEDIVQKPCRGFAWPCGRTTPSTVELLRRNGFAYGRTTNNRDDVTTNEEPLLLDSNCHYQACDFYRRFEKARETGVFYFWGHSYEMYRYDELWAHFEEKIRFLSEDPDVEWVNVIDLVPLLRGGKQ